MQIRLHCTHVLVCERVRVCVGRSFVRFAAAHFISNRPPPSNTRLLRGRVYYTHARVHKHHSGMCIPRTVATMGQHNDGCDVRESPSEDYWVILLIVVDNILDNMLLNILF